MLRYVYHALESFQSVFSRHRIWLLFAAVVLRFLAASEMIGVTSMWRFWRGEYRVYHTLYLRTRSRALPSQKTIQHVLAPRVVKQLLRGRI